MITHMNKQNPNCLLDQGDSLPCFNFTDFQENKGIISLLVLESNQQLPSSSFSNVLLANHFAFLPGCEYLVCRIFNAFYSSQQFQCVYTHRNTHRYNQELNFLPLKKPLSLLHFIVFASNFKILDLYPTQLSPRSQEQVLCYVIIPWDITI